MCFGLAIALLWLSIPGAAFEGTDEREVSLGEFQRSVLEKGCNIQSFRIEGTVCAVSKERRWVVLQDSSAAVLLEIPFLDSAVLPGEQVAVEGNNCAVTRGGFGLRLGTAPVVENDQLHEQRTKDGTIYLQSGMQPLRLGWFGNGTTPLVLAVEYEGAGIARQAIPNQALWHSQNSSSVLLPGLEFNAYLTSAAYSVPDFEKMDALKSGVATNFDVRKCIPTNRTGLLFKGFLQIPTNGFYTFHLTSIDGSRLYVGDPAATCKVVKLQKKTAPIIHNYQEALAAPDRSQWVSMQGEVRFAGQDENGLRLELANGGTLFQVSVIGGRKWNGTNFPGQRMRVTGVCAASVLQDAEHSLQIVALNPGTAEFSPVESDRTPVSPSEALITSEAEIHRMNREKARKPCKVDITGVVTWNSPVSLVLHDGSAGVFIHLDATNWTDQPAVGELWEIQGTTGPGDFSPVVYATNARFLGHAPFPEPVHPRWEELMNGSLDAQYVEIRGVVTAIAPFELSLLTSDGKVKIVSNTERPVPYLPDPSSCLDGIVKIRGCLTAQFDWNTSRTKAGEICLSPATVEIEERSPSDPFSLPTRKTAELLTFDPNPNTLQRTKLAGQVIYSTPYEQFLLDGQVGLRALTKEQMQLSVGDLVEVVGFPQLGGPSAVLRETLLRKTGSAALPAPVSIPQDDLLNRDHDSTLVRVEGVLVNDITNRNGRVLELQDGTSHFLARLALGLEKWKPLTTGSRLQLTGVYSWAAEDRAGNSLNSFELLLNSDNGIVVLKRGPWWTVRRAITAAATLAGALGFAFIWITMLRRTVDERTAQLQRQIEKRQIAEQRRAMEEERMRVAQDLHDELGAGLTEVSILGGLARNPSIPEEKKHEYLDQITDAARSLVTGLDEIVWAVNPQYDSVASMATYYSLFAQRFLQLAGIACRLQIAKTFPEYPLDSRSRHGIFLAFKEAFNNIVRHSQASEVRLRIEVIDAELILSIADNGRGFQYGTAAPGSDGLAGMEQRLRKMGGSCQIESQPGRGTSVTFRLQLEKMGHDKNRHS